LTNGGFDLLDLLFFSQLSVMTYQPAFILLLGALATFRLSHLMTKEREPLAAFAHIRNALPGGRGSAKEWLSCILCFSLTASALICFILWAGGLRLSWDYWILHWLSFSSVSLLINQACK